VQVVVAFAENDFRVVPVALHEFFARNRRQDDVVADARFRVRTARWRGALSLNEPLDSMDPDY
jgi:hypothetical protein